MSTGRAKEVMMELASRPQSHHGGIPAGRNRISLMWTVDPNDLFRFRDGTGRAFTRFVDALIRTHGFVYGVGESETLTSLRTNIGDGGVDTQVRCGMPGDSTGYLALPTCWQ